MKIYKISGNKEILSTSNYVQLQNNSIL